MPTQVEKLRKFQGGGGEGGGSDKNSLEWKFQGSEGSKAKVPSVGGGAGRGMDFFSNYTLCLLWEGVHETSGTSKWQLRFKELHKYNAQT